jgi:hypothetical protein
MVLDVDQTRLRATLARSNDNPDKILSYSQGSYEPLPNGDWFAGWGSVPQFTEFGPSGDVRLNVEMLGGPGSYRAFRLVWHARPATPPALVARRVNGAIELSASWNGATDVASWRVLAGPDAGSLAPAGTFVKQGFETTMSLPAGAAVFEVQAVGPQGRVQATSKPVSAAARP